MASLVVAGGGLAGLACAWRLARAGHDVEVLEQESEAGGALRCAPLGEFRLDGDASFVPGDASNLEALVRSLGLGEGLERPAAPSLAVLREGRFHTLEPGSFASLATTPLLSAASRARLCGLGVWLRWRRQLDPEHPELTADLDDGTSAAELANAFGGEAMERLLAPVLRLALEAEPEELSRVQALLLARRIASGLSARALPGGTDHLVRALAGRVSVRSGCEVVSIETQTDGARVRYRSAGRKGSVLADGVVVALPARSVGAVCAKLTPAERGFFAAQRSGRALRVQVLLDRAPEVADACALAFPRSEGIALRGVFVEHQKAGAAPIGAGLLTVSLAAADVERLWDAPPPSVVAHALGELARTPLGRLEPLAFSVRRPQRARVSPGSIRSLAWFLARVERSPRLAFAGGYLLGSGPEAAATSGARAATEVVASLGQ